MIHISIEIIQSIIDINEGLYIQSQSIQELSNLLNTKPDFHSAKFWLAVFQAKSFREFTKFEKKICFYIWGS